MRLLYRAFEIDEEDVTEFISQDNRVCKLYEIAAAENDEEVAACAVELAQAAAAYVAASQ